MTLAGTRTAAHICCPEVDPERWLLNLKHVETTRVCELESVLAEIRSEKSGRISILEVGAGAGFQAKRLAETGYEVAAIDIKDSNYGANRIWPILEYDGENIPFPNNHFDVVYSSHVLEHIPHVRRFQAEIRRVLKIDGIAIHVVPSATWRLWTNLAHYAYVLKVIIYVAYWRMACGKGSRAHDAIASKIGGRPWRALLRRAMLASRHGETGNALSEMYHFSRPRWREIFLTSGWTITKCAPGRLFYTGYMILGPSLSPRWRRLLSHVLGSSSHVFVLTKGAMVG